MCKNKDNMYAKMNRKKFGFILGNPVWKKIALARYHCGYEAYFPIFTFNGSGDNFATSLASAKKVVLAITGFHIEGVLEISGPFVAGWLRNVFRQYNRLTDYAIAQRGSTRDLPVRGCML